LYENVLTKDDPNDYIARVVPERSLSVKDISESAAARGGADVSAAAIEHAVNLWLKEMAYQLCNGFSVNTGYFLAVALILGPFRSLAEKFDRKKHKLMIDFRQGEIMRKELATAEVDILGAADVNLSVLQVADVRSGTIDEFLTPGYNLRIAGYKLKIVGDKPGVGVRFVSQETPDSIYEVSAVDIVVNNPSELIIVIPDMPTGDYKLEITTQYAVSSVLKEPRTTVFDKILTVE
jgi:hypothetical protein